MMKLLGALLLITCITGCNNEPSVHLSDEISSVHTVTNGGLSVELQFMGTVNLENEQVAWDESLRQPYIDAANQWLSVLKGVEGKPTHKIKIAAHVTSLNAGNGMAGPDEEEIVGQYHFPVSGEMVIGNHTYALGFDQTEFHANIIHEMGHIFGVGSFTEQFTEYSETYKGLVFKTENSVSIEKYNQLYGADVKALPISDDGGHLYDYVLQEDKQRILDNGELIPPMTKEVMSNGFKLGVISAAILDDIGYLVDYSKVTSYTP